MRRVGSWFVASAGMNLYRGCAHDCAYCDGRAEKYRADGEFGRDVVVKTNALEILARELGTASGGGELWPEMAVGRARGHSGFILVGGGVGDSYQPLEKEYRLARGALELLAERKLPVHILTKSTLVLRDLDVLTRINGSTRAVVSFSISSADDGVSAVFEPGASPPSERLGALAALKRAGLACGIYLLPVIPYVTDTEDDIAKSVRAAKDAGADFVIFGGMTLKEGRQKDHFLRVLAAARPGLEAPCRALYANRDRWGAAGGGHYGLINARFASIARVLGVSPRMPLRLFKDLLTDKDRVIVLLEHMHAMRELDGAKSPYGWAAFKVSRHAGPPSEIGDISRDAKRAIEEIMTGGTSSVYEELAAQYSQGAK
jgi:DNA repair photolyase